jgi:hypothetical protein
VQLIANLLRLLLKQGCLLHGLLLWVHLHACQ